MSCIAIFTTTTSKWLVGWNALSLGMALFIRYIYGPGDFSMIKTRGQYEVGYRHYHVDKNENAVGVYYPLEMTADRSKYPLKKWYDYPG